MHRWKKRIYRGALKSEGLNPILLLRSFLHITCHTYSVSLAELTCNPRTLNEAPYIGLFLLEVTGLLTQGELLVSCCHLLYLIWVYYFLFDSCCMFSDCDCLRHSRISEFCLKSLLPVKPEYPAVQWLGVQSGFSLISLASFINRCRELIHHLFLVLTVMLHKLNINMVLLTVGEPHKTCEEVLFY